MTDLRAAILAWYDADHRTMPWRSEPTPWRVWVSEIMLQQTRVESVIPYFHRFLARFPTPKALAAAPLDEVLGLWAGLGYYSRARNLHAAAQQVVAQHQGQIPNDPDAFLALKGVGRYTCGAVMSIAFGRDEPVLDGNVMRVLCRVDHVEVNPRTSATQRQLWARSAALVKGERPGDFNQALMELGAVICTPKQPQCGRCPIHMACGAYQMGDAERLPIRPKRKARPREVRIAGLSRDAQGRIWLVRRPLKGLLAGLWELPGLAVEAIDPRRLAEIGLSATGPGTRIEHGFTHLIWEVHVFEAQGEPVVDATLTVAAFTVEQIATLALAGPALKALRACGIPLAHRRGAGRCTSPSRET